MKSKGTLAPVLRTAALIALAGSGTGRSQPSLITDSPFLPRETGGAVATGAEAYELAGSTVQGSEVTLCIYDAKGKRTRWIPVGQTVDGIRAVSYDPVRDEAVVTVSGTRMDLSLRKELVQSQRTTTASAPPQSRPASYTVSEATPESDSPKAAAATSSDQREARMLVSDLLEIGIEQRKAYEKAKQDHPSPTAAQPQ